MRYFDFLDGNKYVSKYEFMNALKSPQEEFGLTELEIRAVWDYLSKNGTIQILTSRAMVAEFQNFFDIEQ